MEIKQDQIRLSEDTLYLTPYEVKTIYAHVVGQKKINVQWMPDSQGFIQIVKQTRNSVTIQALAEGFASLTATVQGIETRIPITIAQGGFRMQSNPDPFPGESTDPLVYPPTDTEDRSWRNPALPATYVDGGGYSTILYGKGGGAEVKRKAIHSGIGDSDDLMVKAPAAEDVILPYQVAVRCKGKRKHTRKIYPKLAFQYSVYYKGKIFLTFNESPYKVRIDAYPAKNIQFKVTETKKLPKDRPWTLQMNVKGVVPQGVLQYAVNWKASHRTESLADIKQLLTTDGTGKGVYVGHIPSDTSKRRVWQYNGTYVYDTKNLGFFSGSISSDHMSWGDYELNFSFKPIKSVEQGYDDDLLGFIFRAKDKRNFYIFLIEAQDMVRHTQIFGASGNEVVSKRIGSSLDGLNIETADESAWQNKCIDPAPHWDPTKNGVAPSTFPEDTSDGWLNYCKTMGWGEKHRRVYRVQNGALSRISIADQGSGQGWLMEQMNDVRIVSAGGQTTLYLNGEKCFNVPTHEEIGSFGICSWSQACEFYNIELAQLSQVEGRVPATGWDTYDQAGSLTLADTGEEYVYSDVVQTLGTSEFVITKVTGERSGSGTIQCQVNQPVIVTTTNAQNAGEVFEEAYTKEGVAKTTPDHINSSQALTISAVDEFEDKVNQFLAAHPEISRGDLTLTYEVLSPTSAESDWDWMGNHLRLWLSQPETILTPIDFDNEKVYAYEGWKPVVRLVDHFPEPNPWTTYELHSYEDTILEGIDEIKMVNQKIWLKTIEYYRGFFPADIKGEGSVTSDEKVYVRIPPNHEHFVHPETQEPMFAGYEEVQYLLYQVTPASTDEVSMAWESHPDQTTRNTVSPLNALNGKPILKTTSIQDRVIIQCEPKSEIIDWNSGRYIGQGEVNGQRPFHTDGAGKSDLTQVSSQVVTIPPEVFDVIGPFVEVEDDRIQVQIDPETTNLSFSSDFQDDYVWYTEWVGNWTEYEEKYHATLQQVSRVKDLPSLDPQTDPTYQSDQIHIEALDVLSNNPYVSVWLENLQLESPPFAYTLGARIKESYPTSWHPMIHNGYYYIGHEEHYLYAKKIHHRVTPNEQHEIFVSPRPQQGAPLMVRDNQGNVLRKVTFYDENWNLTLENKEEFTGSGESMYYLSYRHIDPATVRVKVNGADVSTYLFYPKDSSIVFMQPIHLKDLVEVRYKLLYSYLLDINYDVEGDRAKIILHSHYDSDKMKDMEIIYEGDTETPFYRAQEVQLNPIAHHHHRGFLYLTKKPAEPVKQLFFNVSPKCISTSGNEKVTLTVQVQDQYDNPIQRKKVKVFRRDGGSLIKIYEGLTNPAGEIYVYDQPPVPDGLIGIYEAECEDHHQIALLNYFANQVEHRLFVELKTDKSAILSGLDDQATVTLTVRDETWKAVPNQSITVQRTDTYGIRQTFTIVTDARGQWQMSLSGITEKQGAVFIQASCAINETETASNILYVKVIGG